VGQGKKERWGDSGKEKDGEVGGKGGGRWGDRRKENGEVGRWGDNTGNRGKEKDRVTKRNGERERLENQFV
jgi:hypothetical protein